ncbi:MAG: PspC domain-containing protein [Desulfobacterales bacterium]|nr:PspC domain-containing protein [Deltaproteobacteria bacterium]NNL77077.1 PspC domain-containing protein [Desulfobacterales bacterium]
MRKHDRLSRSGIYRSRNGAIFGVCRGLAEHFDFSVFWARAIAIIFLLVSGFWPAIGLYLIAALLMKPAPVVPIKTEAEQEFYDSYTNSRHLAARRIKRRYENLENRIRRMEHIVTARDFDWDEKLNS